MGKLMKAWQELKQATSALIDRFNECRKILESPPIDLNELKRAAKQLKAAAANASEKLTALVRILDELKKKRGEQLKKNKKLMSKFNRITQTKEIATKNINAVALILAAIELLLGKNNLVRA